VELLVVMIVVGLLAGASVPLFRDQQRRSLDRTVAADLNRYEVAAERLFSATYGYPVTNTGFDLHDQGNPDANSGNTFRAFTVPSGAWAGYVVYGQNSTTSSVLVLSSYTGGDPVATSLRALPTVPPTAGTLNVPASVVAASWSSLPGLTWGAVSAISGATRIPFYDPTLLSTVKVPSSTAPAGNIYPYNPALFRVVDLASPVASRAVEVVTTAGTSGQGLIIYPQTPAARWPAVTPVGAAGEQWTVSAWVRAGVGQGMSIGCRVQSSSLTYVTEVNGAGSSTVEGTTGDWQRISFTCTTAASWVGKYVAVEVFTPDTTPGRTYYVTAPQLNKGSVASPFSLG
jgi:type II secretory pathway pseudopilin PulG